MTDSLTPKQRSTLMSRVRGKDTGIERQLRSALHKRGLRFRKNVRGLPGTPDIVFVTKMIAVFVDGDFWHGYRFPVWEHKLNQFWSSKIAMNRQRDQRNFAKLRRWGWTVIRVWQHEIEGDLEAVVKRIYRTVKHE